MTAQQNVRMLFIEDGNENIILDIFGSASTLDELDYIVQSHEIRQSWYEIRPCRMTTITKFKQSSQEQKCWVKFTDDQSLLKRIKPDYINNQCILYSPGDKSQILQNYVKLWHCGDCIVYGDKNLAKYIYG